jgi:hypothetical protein
VVQEEEPGQVEVADQRELLVQPRRRRRAQGRAARVAAVEQRRADLRELAVGGVVLRAGIAVAEVGAEVEGQRGGQARGLGDRVRVVLEARGHRARRRQHVRVVATPLRLGGVERRVLADRHERVLQAGPRRLVRVDVAGRHARDAQPRGEIRQLAVAGAVVPVEGALQLDPERVGPEDGQQRAGGRRVVHAMGRAAREADQALGVLGEVVDRQQRPEHAAAPGRVARVGMSAREQATEVAPAGGVADQQRDVVRPALVVLAVEDRAVALLARRVGVDEVDLRAVDRPEPQRRGGLRELHRPRDAVVVGQRERLVAAVERRGDQLLRQRGAVQEREGRMAVELDVRHEHMFA